MVNTYNMFLLVSSQVNDMNIDQVVRAIQDVDIFKEEIDRKLEYTDVKDWYRTTELLGHSENLQLCLEILNERLDELLEVELEQTFAMLDLVRELL